MADVADRGTSETHSVSSAAVAIEGLLSGTPEDGTTRETPVEAPEVTSADAAETPVEAQADDEQQPDVETESEETDETPDEVPVQPRKIKVSDEIGEVTEDELRSGYLRQQDYTRKTQALAEDKKKSSSDAEAVRAERAEYATRLTELRSAIEAQTPKEPDWDKLRTEMEPADFAASYAMWDNHKKRLSSLKEQERVAHEKVTKDQADMIRTHLATEKEKLLAAVPSWKDEKVATQERKAMVDYALSLGFSEKELQMVTDHRLMLLLRDGSLQAKAAKAAPIAQQKIDKVKVAAPGTPVPAAKREVAEVTRRKQRLAKTGSIADAASVFESLL